MVELGRPLLAADDSADYAAILHWFSKQNEWTADTARMGSLMVYGWMPTMIKTEKTDFERFADFLNRGVADEIAEPFVNASWVGTSKFLHFWRPNQWAIWDSRVCWALGWGSLPNDAKMFSEYQVFCRRFTDENGDLPLRQVEQCLYLLGKKISDENKRNGQA